MLGWSWLSEALSACPSDYRSLRAETDSQGRQSGSILPVQCIKRKRFDIKANGFIDSLIHGFSTEHVRHELWIRYRCLFFHRVSLVLLFACFCYTRMNKMPSEEIVTHEQSEFTGVGAGFGFRVWFKAEVGVA